MADRRARAGTVRVTKTVTSTAIKSSHVEVTSDRGVFMISVAAELAEMHPQTLRMYEARGLIEPKRSPKGTRLYSHQDVERLRRVQGKTAEVERLEQLRRELRAEIVPYQRGGEIVRRKDLQRFRIPIEHGKADQSPDG